MKHRIIFFLVWCIALLAFAVFLVRFISSQRTGDSHPRIYVTVHILKEFTQAIVGSDFDVVSLTPPGIEPHDFEPSSRDISNLNTAELFILNGNGLDPWAVNVAQDLSMKGKNVLNISTYLADLSDRDEIYIRNGDPHFWLDPVLAQHYVRAIQRAVLRIEGTRASVYSVRAREYLKTLSTVTDAFARSLKTCARHELIVSHDAMWYIAKRYTLSAIPIAGLSSFAEPDPKHMADIIRLLRARKGRAILSEMWVNPKIAQTITREVDVEILAFDSIESQRVRADGQEETYPDRMMKNLTQIKQALVCE